MLGEFHWHGHLAWSRGFLTIIAVVTPYYSNNYYISCDKFDSH